MKKLVIIQTTVPDYRKNFFDYLYESLPNKFVLYGGDEYFETSTKSDENIRKNKVGNHFLFGRKFLFQTKIWHLLFKDIVLVLELNPRIISNWIFLLIRYILKKETVLWGHAWSRKGVNSKTDWLRNTMRRLSSRIIVYTNKQKEELQEKMPTKKIEAAPNAVLKSEEIKLFTHTNDINNLIYVGRLTKAKKPFYLVDFFYKNISILPKEVKLLLVGDGEEKEKIQKFVREKKIEERVLIKGHISDYEQLKKMYSQSLFSVSPGYIGLSVTQSFGFGVPMLVSENENHSPEIEAVIPNKNALYYKTDDVVDFGKNLQQIFKDKEIWINKRAEIIQFCKEKYTVEAMGKTFVNLVK